MWYFDSQVSSSIDSDHTPTQVRRRHSTFPVSTGEDWEHEQPTNLVHIGANNP